jgi:hypothetical protein
MAFPDIMQRSRSFDLAPAVEAEDPSAIRMIASTSAAVGINVSVDGEDQVWNEILEHDERCVDISAAKSLLLNHDAGAIIGSVRNITFDGNSAFVDANILEGARLSTGVLVRDAVRSGALKGVSIGYRYRMDEGDASVDYDTRTIRVSKWRMLEVTLTPIPADPVAGVRSLASPKGSTMTEPVTAVPAITPVAVSAPVVDHTAIRAEAKKIATLADSHKLRSADYVGLSLADAQEKILVDISARDAKNIPDPKSIAVSTVVAGEDAMDKAAKRAIGAMLWTAGFRHTEKAGDHEFEDGTKLKDYQQGNTIRGRTVSDICRSTLEAVGVRAGELDRHALARTVLGLHGGARDAGNVGTGFFPNFVFLNLVKKAVSVGFSMGSSSIKYKQLAGRNYVPDYRQFAIGGLGVGNLQQTIENAAFPELDKAEGVYLDRVKMWGGTLSLSEQAIVSDDTGRFMDNLRMAGVIAQKTIDKRFFQKLLMGTSLVETVSTWTSNTTAASLVAATNDAVIAARANLAKVESALMQKVGLDGNPTGNMARFLIVPPDLQYQAVGLLGIAPGQQNNVPLRYEVVTTPWLQFSGLTGNSATSYYLMSDPAEATGLVLSTINGIDEPRVEQYDPGAVAAYKWKIYQPFEVGMGFHSVSGVNTIAGIQQGT